MAEVNMSKIHSDYSDKMNQANKAHENEMENVSESDKKSRATQKEAYDKGVSKAENSYKTEISRMSDSQKESLATKSELYDNALKGERNTFHKLSQGNQKEFQGRLADISHDYKQIRNAENSYHKEKSEHDVQRHDEALKNIQGDYNKQLKGYEDRSVGVQGEVREKYLNDKNEVVKGYETRINQMSEQYTKGNNQLKNKIDHDMEEMRRAQNQDLHTTRDNGRKNFENLKHNYADKSRKQEEQFQGIKHQTSKDHASNSLTRNRDFKKAFSHQNELNRKSVNNLRNELNGVGSRSSEFSKRINDVNKDQKNSISENKFNQYKNEREQLAKTFHGTVNAMNDKYGADLSHKQQVFKNEIEEVKNVDAISRLEERIGHNNKYDIMSQKFDEKYKNDKADFEREVVDKENFYSTKMNNLKQAFDRTIKDTRRKNEFHMKDYKQNVHDDKKHYYDKMKAAMKDEIRRKDKTSDLKYNTMNEGHYEVNRALSRENGRVKIDIKDQKDNLRADFQEVLSFERSHAEMQREADFEAFKNLSMKKTNTLHQHIKDLHEGYKDRLEKTTYTSDRKIAKLTRNYENQIVNLRKKNENVVMKTKADDKNELHRVKLALETERDAMIAKYKDQILEIKRTYQNQMERVSEFHMNQINESQQT